MNQLEMYLEVLDIELDSADVKSILYHALLPKCCDFLFCYVIFSGNVHLGCQVVKVF